MIVTGRFQSVEIYSFNIIIYVTVKCHLITTLLEKGVRVAHCSWL